jgi:hypothetical protein
MDEYHVNIERVTKPPPPVITLSKAGHEYLDLNLGEIEDIPDSPMKITKYRFEFKAKNDFEKLNNFEWKDLNVTELFATPGEAIYTISHLKPNTTYLMSVASINDAGLSDWTLKKEFTTLAYETENKNNSKMLDLPLYLLLLTITYFLGNFIE